jgi:hypothetical protein
LAASKRQLLEVGTADFAVVWQSRSQSEDGLIALIAGPRFQQREWFGALQSQVLSGGVHVALATAGGSPVFGDLPRDDSSVVRRSPAETGLPWTVLVTNADPIADLDGFAHRRRMLLMSLSFLIFLVIAGGYFVLRAASREFAVAQLQSDFVSAVSHEFFPLQMAASLYWFRSFRVGPAEWLWRSLSYGCAQPMRIVRPMKPDRISHAR